jgi:hypothetical protein
MDTAVESDVDAKLMDVHHVRQSDLGSITRPVLAALVKDYVEKSKRESDTITAFANYI